MAENIEKSLTSPEEEIPEIYTLTDEEGNETDFELIAYGVLNDNLYYAMIPVDSEAKGSGDDIFEEYVILKSVVDENGDEMLESIEDDEEFDSVADFFDNQFDEEFNYDK